MVLQMASGIRPNLAIILGDCRERFGHSILSTDQAVMTLQNGAASGEFATLASCIRLWSRLLCFRLREVRYAVKLPSDSARLGLGRWCQSRFGPWLVRYLGVPSARYTSPEEVN